MLCYVSISDNHTGKFIAGVHLEAADVDAACAAAAALLPLTCLETAGCEIPAHLVHHIPRKVIGKLCSRAELDALSRAACGKGIIEMISDGETIRRKTPAERTN